MGVTAELQLTGPIKTVVTPKLAPKVITVLKHLKYENSNKSLDISLTKDTFIYVYLNDKYEVIDDDFIFELCYFPRVSVVEFLRSVKITKT